MQDPIKHNSAQNFSISGRFKSFNHAWSGIKTILRTEHNSRVHLVFTFCALVLSFVFKLSLLEFSILVVVISIVWIAELFNTCIEKIMDFISIEKHPQIKRIKDMAAAAVMLASISALIVGIIIFISKIV